MFNIHKTKHMSKFNLQKNVKLPKSNPENT